PRDTSRSRRYLTAALSWLPAENFGTVLAGMVTFWPGFRGLTAVRALRCWTLNLPKPVKTTSSPLDSASLIDSSVASTAAVASFLDRPLLSATLSMNSLFVTLFLLVGYGPESVQRRHPTTGIGRQQSACLGGFRGVGDAELRTREERKKLDPGLGDGLRAALLAINDANCSGNVEICLPERLHSRELRAPRRDHVLDHADPLAGLENALQPLRRAVPLGLLALQQVRQVRLDRGHRRQRHRTQLGPREELGVRRV